MTRVIVAALALLFSASWTSASPWPEFQQHPYPVDAEDVKAFWFEALPRPKEPRRNDSGYIYKINAYHQTVSNGRSLIRRLQAGFFDREAHLVALRHNLAYYQRKGLQLSIETTEDAIALAEADLLVPPAVPASSQVAHLPSTALRTSRLRLARLESSGGLHPTPPPRPTVQPNPGPSHNNRNPEPNEPEVIYIEEEEDDNYCPQPEQPHHRPPRHRPSPPLDIKPWPQIPNPPSPPQKPSAPPSSPQRSAPTRSDSASFFNQSTRRSK